MSEGYKIRDQFKPHYVTFTVTDWVDVFSRKNYRDIIIDSFKYCQKQKGLIIFGYCIMSNHIHAILQPAIRRVRITLHKVSHQLFEVCA
jgi:REP element-mobilizing transposase RayT